MYSSVASTGRPSGLSINTGTSMSAGQSGFACSASMAASSVANSATFAGLDSVSYTHLTLPTIYSV